MKNASMSTLFTEKDLDRTTFLNAVLSERENAWKLVRHVCESIVIGIAKSQGLSPQDTASALADAIKKAWSQAGTFQKLEGGTFRAWLRAIVKNCVIDVQRKEGREPINRRASFSIKSSEEEQPTATAEKIPDPDSPEFGARLDYELEEALIKEAIQNLRTRRGFHFQVATLAFVHQNTTEEIAGILKRPAAMVAVWRFRSRTRLRKEIKRLQEEICRKFGGVW